MDTKELLASIQRSRTDTQRHLHELEAHRKTLAVELARIDKDMAAAKQLHTELSDGMAAISRFQPNEAA